RRPRLRACQPRRAGDAAAGGPARARAPPAAALPRHPRRGTPPDRERPGLSHAAGTSEGGIAMTYKCLLYDVKDGVATLTLNRPERLNALGDTLREDLHDAVTRASADPEVRAMIVTGS